MAESMKDYETELEASFKKIEEGDILTGTVISVDEKMCIRDRCRSGKNSSDAFYCSFHY